jgi:hypothetical protein
LVLATSESKGLFMVLRSAILIFTDILTLDFLPIHLQNKLPNLQSTGFERGTVLLQTQNFAGMHSMEMRIFFIYRTYFPQIYQVTLHDEGKRDYRLTIEQYGDPFCA